jgi:hypothetical protein
MKATKIHYLKTSPLYFQSIVDGLKTFEYRKNDRAFKVEDILILQEYNPTRGDYTGRTVAQKITYVLSDTSNFPITKNWCILGLSDNVGPHRRLNQLNQRI